MGKIFLLLWMSINAKNVTTDIANRTELTLRQNRDAYFAGPNTQERKDAALRRYEEVWEEFIGPDGCGSSALRTYGQRYIQERMPRANHDWAGWYLQPIKDSATQIVITPGGGGFRATAGKR